MATTTNYGWTTPDDTALVKDGASAIRTLGSSVDTTTKNLNPSTTLGDIEYRSSTANTNTRLGIGSSGQVLTVSGGVPAWVTAAGGGSSYTLLNTGGTSLTGASTTVSSLSAEKFLVFISGASGSDDMTLSMRINADTGSNYVYSGWMLDVSNLGSDNTMPTTTTGGTSLPMVKTNGAAGVSNAVIYIDGGKSTGFKSFDLISSCPVSAGTNLRTNHLKGIYKASAAITSLTFIASGVNFDAGTVFIYGSD